ncbi:MAG: ATP-binding protein [Cyanobacteria bacterium P01_A01_bin.84]
MLLESHNWQQKQKTLKILSSLSYRNGHIDEYLKAIACGVSQLVMIDWSVVTLYHQGFGKVLASSIDLGEEVGSYSVHGQLSGTVVKSGSSLIVEDTQRCIEYGQAPSGYRAYLGVPLSTSTGEVIGTICLFHKAPRKFSPEEVSIAELFAERAATALDNYHLYLQQRKFNEILEVEVARRTEELKRAQEQLVERERLAAIGEFASGIIHEIRNPFTTMKMGLNYFKKVDLSEPSQIRLSLALDEADRLEKLLKEILLYAKPQTLALKPIQINKFIDKLLKNLKLMPAADNRIIEFEPGSDLIQVLGDEDKLKQVLINLVRNACEAIDDREAVKIKVINHRENNLQDSYRLPNNQQIHIQIHNYGKPIPPEILPKLTQPFYSTKSSGTGLGLAIVKRIITAHNGELLIDSSAQTGTTFSVRLPICN